MTRVRLILISCMAVLGLFAANAVAAQAGVPQWHVAGSPLTGEEAFTATSAGVIKLTGGGLELESIECQAVDGMIQGNTPGTDTEKLSCGGVEVAEFGAVCEAHSPGEPENTITTNPLESTLVYLTEGSGKSVGTLFEPATGDEFVGIELGGAEELEEEEEGEMPEGGECPIGGTYPVTGAVIGEFAQEGEEEFKEGQLEFPSPPITTYYAGTEAGPTELEEDERLEVKANQATFSGTFDLKLNSEEEVGVFPG